MAIKSQNKPPITHNLGPLRKHKNKEANLQMRLNMRQNKQHYQKIINTMLNKQDKDVNAVRDKETLKKNVKKLFANYQPTNCSLSEMKPVFPPPLKTCCSSNDRNRRVAM